MITIYTDGSCLNNPGNGGWAAIININNDVKKISGSVKDTTNNKMELMAPIKALQEIKEKQPIELRLLGTRQCAEAENSQGAGDESMGGGRCGKCLRRKR